MNTYRVKWVENHSADVQAKDYEEAMDKALRLDNENSRENESIKSCELIGTQEQEHDDMDLPKLEDDKNEK